MFDRLIVSEAEGIGKSRRKYFVTSSIVVGIVFITAVVLSIYADDYGLSDLDLELSQLTAPIETVASEPEPVRQQAPPAAKDTAAVEKTVRTPNVVESTQVPTKIPDGVSTEPNHAPVAPKGNFEIGKVNTDASDPVPSGRTATSGPAGGDSDAIKVAEVERIPIPDPPAVTIARPRPPVIRSKGVINGEAKSLPIPVYPQIAKMAGAKGLVKVQVTLDESGRVVAANAVEGHVMLTRGAEQAARDARFSPTLLNDTPVKVTGVIVYNFR